jgi:hypothetical protein
MIESTPAKANTYQAEKQRKIDERGMGPSLRTLKIMTRNLNEIVRSMNSASVKLKKHVSKEKDGEGDKIEI